jgi:hypothetical protein
MLSGLFGVLGALLAALGLYGLLAYTVARRFNEIGIRMALGATGRDVMGMVVKSAMALVAAGLLIGVPLAFWIRPVAASVVENLPADSSRADCSCRCRDARRRGIRCLAAGAPRRSCRADGRLAPRPLTASLTRR